MTQPDAPNSPTQRYGLKEKGRELLRQAAKDKISGQTPS